MKKITIVGAGLVGSLLSIYLAKRGYEITLFERRADLRGAQIAAGRSINLAISVRGIHALTEIGLASETLKNAIPMYGRMVHTGVGDLSEQPYSINPVEYINSISRADLNIALLNHAESFANVNIQFNSKVIDFNFNDSLVILENKTHKTDLVIAADGASSLLRQQLQSNGLVSFNEEHLPHGYKELTIPADCGQPLAKNYLHIWPRQAYMLIALPNRDGTYTCTLFLPHKNDISFQQLTTPQQVSQFFKSEFSDAYPLLANLENEFFTNPTGGLKTIKGCPWNVNNKVLFIGDAAHAIFPFFGQGMNCGFEDCTLLNELLDQHHDDWDKVLIAFDATRKTDTDAIADMSYENYLEMRDLVADANFHLQKAIEKELVKRYPNQYVPKYNLVSFTRNSYSYAKKCGELQQTLLANLSLGINSINELDWEKAEAEIIQAINAMNTMTRT